MELQEFKTINKTYIKNNNKYIEFKCEKCNENVECSTRHLKYRTHRLCKKCVPVVSGTKNGMFKHGLVKHRIYWIWIGMLDRCYNKNNASYGLYGGSGIEVCEEWQDGFKLFFKWANENEYSKDLSIDRINCTGNYEPSNCRWTTRTIQSRNTKRIQKNNSTGYRGVSRLKNRSMYRARIKVDYKEIHIGCARNAFDCAILYDKYVFDNNLEHTTNFTREEIEAIGWANNEEYLNDK